MTVRSSNCLRFAEVMGSTPTLSIISYEETTVLIRACFRLLVDKKKFDKTLGIPRWYISARSNSVESVALIL